MSTVKLLFAEIRYRKINFVLSLFAVTIAVTLFVAGPMLVDGYGRETRTQIEAQEVRVAELKTKVDQMEADMNQVEATTAAEFNRLDEETRKLMLEMGFNLMIVHKDTNMSDFWAEDFASKDMPQEYADRLAGDNRLILITHLVATLQQKITWEDRKVLLVGYLPESTQSHMRKKSPMGYNIAPGYVLLGYELGVGREKGQKITIFDQEFTVAHIQPEKGSKEDITIAMHLSSAQGLLDKPGKINQILALGCNCADSDLPHIRKQLAEILPDTHITERQSIALARAEQREAVRVNRVTILTKMQENLLERQRLLDERTQILADMADARAKIQKLIITLADVLTPLVVLASAIWVGLLALSNARERRTEIGLLRAIGKGTGTIAGLFLGKAVLLGLFGAAVGLLLGTAMARLLGSSALDVTVDQFTVHGDVLLLALIGAPLLSAVASYLPTLSALMQDPAVVLRDH